MSDVPSVIPTQNGLVGIHDAVNTESASMLTHTHTHTHTHTLDHPEACPQACSYPLFNVECKSYASDAFLPALQCFTESKPVHLHTKTNNGKVNEQLSR